MIIALAVWGVFIVACMIGLGSSLFGKIAKEVERKKGYHFAKKPQK